MSEGITFKPGHNVGPLPRLTLKRRVFFKGFSSLGEEEKKTVLEQVIFQNFNFQERNLTFNMFTL